eukprot:4500680-Pyramimonas_sp.AAC.1
MTGRVYGPARVLASEIAHRRGEAKARPRVWLNACGRLIRCDLCQLRDASDREIAEHGILHGAELPWTFNQLTSNLRPGQYEDLAEDERLIPSDRDHDEATVVPPLPTVVEEDQPPRHRLHGKRSREEHEQRSKAPKTSS